MADAAPGGPTAAGSRKGSGVSDDFSAGVWVWREAGLIGGRCVGGRGQPAAARTALCWCNRRLHTLYSPAGLPRSCCRRGGRRRQLGALGGLRCIPMPHRRNLGPYSYFADEDDDDDEEYSGTRRKSGDRRGGASSSAAGRHRRKGAGNPGAWRLCKLLAAVVHGAGWRDQSMAREGLEAGCRRSQAGSMHESPPAALGPPGMWRGVHLAAPPPCLPR